MQKKEQHETIRKTNAEKHLRMLPLLSVLNCLGAQRLPNSNAQPMINATLIRQVQNCRIEGRDLIYINGERRTRILDILREEDRVKALYCGYITFVVMPSRVIVANQRTLEGIRLNIPNETIIGSVANDYNLYLLTRSGIIAQIGVDEYSLSRTILGRVPPGWNVQNVRLVRAGNYVLYGPVHNGTVSGIGYAQVGLIRDYGVFRPRISGRQTNVEEIRPYGPGAIIKTEGGREFILSMPRGIESARFDMIR